MRSVNLFTVLFCVLNYPVFAQVDTTLIYKPNTEFGTIDIRLSKRAGHSYYLQENNTFSFRKNNEVPTNTYLKMTAWDSSPYTQGNMREKADKQDLFVMNYRLLKPQSYASTLSQGYPLVVVLHGKLERGNCADTVCYHANKEFSPNTNNPPAPSAPDHMLFNNDYNLVHAGLDYLEAHNINGTRLPDDPALPSGAYPGFVLFPQNTNGWDAPASQDVIKLIRLLIKRYNIDPNRIYINGISHGGHGAYEVLKRAPWMFAAAVMFSAADDASLVSQKMAGKISGIPLWIFQGALDANPTQNKTENYIRAFRKAGANVRYTLYPHLGHGTWNEALDEPDFFSWMLGQNRSSIHVDGGNASICPTSDQGRLLILPEGFKSYEWELNGMAIPNAGTNKYLATQPGIYRGRFLMFEYGSEGRWSNWSGNLNVTVQTAASAQTEQIGTLLLRDLNGNPDARLQAVGDYPYYYWYKDGKSLKTQGIPDTLKSVTLRSQLGSGAYSLRVAGYDLCQSSESTLQYIIFDDKAPVNLPSPFNFKAEAISPSEIFLTWSDTSQNENGFEIWRKRKDAKGTFSAWEMPVLTKANVTSFNDKALSPASVYHYKIRSVNNSGRSNYTPGGQQDVIVTTPPDTESPSAPGELKATQAGVNAIRLSWKPSVDNSFIREYIIFYNNDSLHTGESDTTFILKKLITNTDYSFTVRAVDQAENVSPSSNLAQGNTYLRGLYYEHSTGAWDNIDMIDWSVAEFSGMVKNFTLSPKTQQDFFNFLFDGFLHIEKQGVYQFRLTSDDGSILNLNDSLLIQNDGIHNINTVTSPVHILEAGPQRITVKYFDYALADTLAVEYKGPDSDGEWMSIPPEALASTMITATENEVANEFDFSVYPNPTSQNRINIELQSISRDPIQIMIIDPAGKTLFENIIDYNTHFAISAPAYIETGMYIISVRQGFRLLKRKIIIQ